jgi:succinate dehydrogenase flavin-adding protein (antitoxin of CptAB toxin-antitoxin module)
MIPHFRRVTSTGKFMRYFTLDSSTNILRKQLLFRSKNLGMKELDLLVGRWATINLSNLDHETLEQFNTEVLSKETPNLNKILLSKEGMP